MAERLRSLTALLGRSVENMLARQLNGDDQAADPLSAKNAMLALAELRSALNPEQDGALANAIDRFQEGARWMNLLNLQASPAPDRGQWIGLNFFVQAARSTPLEEPDLHAVRLRIARDSDPNATQVRPGYTRLVIQVEVAPDEILQVGFPVVERQIGAEINASTPGLAQIAQANLPDLQAGLGKIGYQLLTYQVRVAPPLPAETFELPKPMSGRVDPSINLRV
jgi:hypothetical protein